MILLKCGRTRHCDNSISCVLSTDGCVSEWEEDSWRDQDWCESDACRNAIEPTQIDLGAFLYEDHPQLAEFR